jgi:glycosyltransferase involved in cell wall biosynthesis
MKPLAKGRESDLVVHIITGLERGGAEAVLLRLVTAQVTDTRVVVVSLTSAGVYGSALAAAGAEVVVLGMRRGRVSLNGLRRLARLLKTLRPDVVQTWMYHADLLGGGVAYLMGIRRIVWGIRNSDLHPRASARSTRWVARACAWLSRCVPTRIVCCSERAAQVHTALGYSANKIVVIPNGYDLARFAPDALAGARWRANWGLAADEPVIGCVARWDPQKDHATLLAGVQQCVARGLPVRCVLVGPGMEDANTALVDLVDRCGLRGRVILAGPTDQVPALMNAFDLHVLASSYGEAFPNAVAESMACGVPNVVTDVGDAALIVGDCGAVVPPGDATALAAAIERLLAFDGNTRAALRMRCRARIEDNFGMAKMIDAYRRLWTAVAEQPA